MSVSGLCTSCSAPAARVCSLCGLPYCAVHMARGTNVCKACWPHREGRGRPGMLSSRRRDNEFFDDSGED